MESINDKDDELIERFLDKELSDPEVLEFESRLTMDSSLSKEVALRLLIRKNLQEERKNQIRARYRTFKTSKGNGNKIKIYAFISGIAACLIFGFVYYNFGKSEIDEFKSSNQEIALKEHDNLKDKTKPEITSDDNSIQNSEKGEISEKSVSENKEVTFEKKSKNQKPKDAEKSIVSEKENYLNPDNVVDNIGIQDDNDPKIESESQRLNSENITLNQPMMTQSLSSAPRSDKMISGSALDKNKLEKAVTGKANKKSSYLDITALKLDTFIQIGNERVNLKVFESKKSSIEIINNEISIQLIKVSKPFKIEVKNDSANKYTLTINETTFKLKYPQ